MLPHSLTFAWALWRQQRIGLAAVAAYLFAGAAIAALLPVWFEPKVAATLCTVLVGLSVNLAVYVLGVFTYGFHNADVLARESCFPAGLFRLPVPTAALAAWPMIYGALAAMLVWLANVLLILGPCLQVLHEQAAPLWWPALFMAAALAWVQALLWTPFGLVGLRCVLLGTLLLGLIPVVVLSVHSGVSEAFLVALFAGLMLAGWSVGYAGVRQARHGNVPNWERVLVPLQRLARWRSRRRGVVLSAQRAQVWFEWRLSGNSLPIMTALVLPAALLPLFFGKNDVLPTAQTLLGVLAAPVVLAGMTGRISRAAADRYGLLSFIATLPLSSAALVSAMLKAAAWSTLAAWVVVLLITLPVIVLTGNLPEASGWWQQGLQEYGAARIVTGAAAVLALLLVWTWKRKVDGLYWGLTGRKWIDALIVTGTVPCFVVLFAVAAWLYKRPETHAVTLAVLPWLLGVLLGARLLLASWALRQATQRGLLQVRTIGRWLACWLLVASVLFALLAWSVPPEIVPAPFLAFAVLFALPGARLSAAPLALAWNRHR